jgi:ABC-type uncharacterized transport system substrate-binding protein
MAVAAHQASAATAPMRQDPEAVVFDLVNPARLVVMPDTFLFTNRKKIISLAERYRLPTIYPFPSFVAEGGLISYGADPIETFTGAATYADRILKGAKPNDLPVQLPTRFYLGLNLTTAKALGISFPPSLLVTAGRGDRMRSTTTVVAFPKVEDVRLSGQ